MIVLTTIQIDELRFLSISQFHGPDIRLILKFAEIKLSVSINSLVTGRLHK